MMRIGRYVEGASPNDVGKLEHTAETQRFVTLHRNGSASLNRIYSRNFDPYDIFDEFKCAHAPGRNDSC